MGVCPHCGAYYLGNPIECPGCKKQLPSPKHVPSTVNYSSKAKELFRNICKAENFGNKILACSTIILVVNILVAIVCAIVFGKDRWGDFSFGSFLLILLAGLIYSGIFYLLSHGFGYLVKSSISTAEDTAKTLHYIQEMEKAQKLSAEGKDSKGV